VRLTQQEKDRLTGELVACLSTEAEVRKIVVFGSFVDSPNPQDLDVAVFQEGSEGYLPLALKYRRITRRIAQRIPLDIVPLRAGASAHTFIEEIDKGVTLFER